MTITNKKVPLQFSYKIGDKTLKHVDHHPYLGVEFAGNLNWEHHINQVVPKAQRTLNLLRRNLTGCSQNTRDLAYKALVRPVLEYAGSAWDPHQSNHVQRLEAVQRKAARFVTGQHDRHVSVSGLMKDLN